MGTFSPLIDIVDRLQIVETGEAGEATKEGSEGRKMAGESQQRRFVTRDCLDAMFFLLVPPIGIL